MEFYAGALLEKCKTFTNEIQSQKQKWLLGTHPNLGRINTTNFIIHIYSNLIEYVTWKKCFEETDQIVALTTLVHEMQCTLKINTIAFATKAEEQATAQTTKKNYCPPKGPYTVDAGRLLKKEDTVTVDEKTWYWWTKYHYSKVIVHNRMYALNKTCEHDAWHNNLDGRKSKAGHTNSKSSTTPSTTQNLNPVKNLALSESLRTSLCNQAGLSSDAVDRIWSDACRDSGNK